MALEKSHFWWYSTYLFQRIVATLTRMSQNNPFLACCNSIPSMRWVPWTCRFRLTRSIAPTSMFWRNGQFSFHRKSLQGRWIWVYYHPQKQWFCIILCCEASGLFRQWKELGIEGSCLHAKVMKFGCHQDHHFDDGRISYKNICNSQIFKSFLEFLLVRGVAPNTETKVDFAMPSVPAAGHHWQLCLFGNIDEVAPLQRQPYDRVTGGKRV